MHTERLTYEMIWSIGLASKWSEAGEVDKNTKEKKMVEFDNFWIFLMDIWKLIYFISFNIWLKFSIIELKNTNF